MSEAGRDRDGLGSYTEHSPREQSLAGGLPWNPLETSDASYRGASKRRMPHLCPGPRPQRPNPFQRLCWLGLAPLPCGRWSSRACSCTPQGEPSKARCRAPCAAENETRPWRMNPPTSSGVTAWLKHQAGLCRTVSQGHSLFTPTVPPRRSTGFWACSVPGTLSSQARRWDPSDCGNGRTLPTSQATMERGDSQKEMGEGAPPKSGRMGAVAEYTSVSPQHLTGPTSRTGPHIHCSKPVPGPSVLPVAPATPCPVSHWQAIVLPFSLCPLPAIGPSCGFHSESISD